MKPFASALESPQANPFALARFAVSREHCGKTDGLGLCAMSMTPATTHRFADRGRERIGASPWDKITMSQRCLKTAEGTLTERLLRGFLASLTTLLFVIAL